MQSEELKIKDILKTISEFSIDSNITNIIKGKVKKISTYQKNITQNEVSDLEYFIEFHSNIERDQYNKICLFNQKLGNFAEKNMIKYRYLQYKYKLNDEFMPIQNILSIQDNSSYVIQNEKKYLCLLICEINPFQPNSNIEYLRKRFIEIGSILKLKKNIDFKVVFFESFNKQNLSNKLFYQKFSTNLTFQEKFKNLVAENYIDNILFYYIPKITSNKLLKTSLEFFVEKEKLPFFLIVNPNNKIIYEGLFHNVDLSKTLDNFERNTSNVVFHNMEALMTLEKEIENFNSFTKDKIKQEITREDYLNIKRILSIEFKEKLSNLSFNFPFSYITEMFCLEKEYNFENTNFSKTYKKALINYFFSKSFKSYYYDLKKMFSDLNLNDKVIDFSTSESKKIIINNFIQFFSSFFKEKTIRYEVSLKGTNDIQIVNTSALSLFENQYYKLSKLYYLMNFHYMTSPFVTFYNFIPCFKLGDSFSTIKYLEKANDSKDDYVFDLKNKEKETVILFVSQNIFQNKSLYENKITKIKEIFIKNENLLKKCYVSVIYFNIFNEFGFSNKSKNELMQQFLALTSPFKTLDFYFLDSSKNPLSSLQYMVYFNKLNTIKSLVLNKENKIIYNGSIMNPNFVSTLDTLINQQYTDNVLTKQLVEIDKNSFNQYKEILDILNDEISLYIERLLENDECKVSYSKCRALTCDSKEVKVEKIYYTIPRIRIKVNSNSEKNKLISYFDSEVFSKIDKNKMILEIIVLSNN